MTEAIYLEDTYLFESTSHIVSKGIDDKGSFIVLDKTIFYPQGGGQPSDQGFVIGADFSLSIIMVRQCADEIRHYTEDSVDTARSHQSVQCQLDQTRRTINARYHTAAHLLGNVVEQMCPMLIAVKGHSFPKEAYVEFQGDNPPDLQLLQLAINDAIVKDYKTTVFVIDPKSFEQKFYKLPYAIPDNKEFRVMKIGDFKPIPCGGTHLSSTGEIDNVMISKVKSKNNMIRISYEVR